MKTPRFVICALCICCMLTLGNGGNVPEDAQDAIVLGGTSGTNTTYAHWSFDKSLATLRNETLQEDLLQSKNKTAADSHKLHIAFTVDYFPAYVERKRQRQYEGMSEAKKAALLSLERCAEATDDAQALVCSAALGEIYLYGNYSVPQVPKKAVHYLEMASRHVLGADAEINARISHSHYLLGFVYSTGMFGELPVDQGKALLHYTVAADQGNVRAAMCLAYRYYSGKSVQKNDQLALYYYSLVARQSYEHLRRGEPDGLLKSYASKAGNDSEVHLKQAYEDWVLAPNIESFAMHLSDFSDGMYGKWASETNPKPAALGGNGAGMYNDELEQQQQGEQEPQQGVARVAYAGSGFELFADDDEDPRVQHITELYTRYRSYYKGGMLTRQRNYTRAFKNAMACSRDSLKMPLVQYYLGGQPVDRAPEVELAGKCTYAVGHMLLRGEGVGQDFARALKWLKTAAVLCGPRDSNVGADLGLIYQYGLGMESGPDVKRALGVYRGCLNSPAISYQWGRMLVQGGDPVSGWKLVSLSAYQGYLPAVWAVLESFSTGNKLGIDPDVAVGYAKRFCEMAEAFVTDLRWAFEQITHGNNGGALVAYGEAAEAGFESAQASIAYMLYPSTGYMDTPPDVPPGRFLAAVECYRESAHQGNLDSLVFLGDLYSHGLHGSAGNVSASPDKAVRIYREASGRRSHQASYDLGLAYESGLGVPLDLHLAKRYYDKALRLMPDAYLPVQIALLRLRFKLWWFRLTGVDSGSSQEQEGLPKRTWHELLSLYQRLRQRQNTVSQINIAADGTLYEDAANRDHLVEHHLDDLPNAPGAANAEGLRDLQEEDIIGKEDLIFSGLFLAFIVFTIVARWRAERRRRNRNGNANADGDANANGNAANANGNGAGLNANGNRPAFQFNFMVVPL